MLSVRTEMQHTGWCQKQNRIESTSMHCRTEEEVGSLDPRGQVVMRTENLLERTGTLKRALDFHKTWGWREGVWASFISTFQRRKVPSWTERTYIRVCRGSLCSKGFTFMSWFQLVFPIEHTSFTHLWADLSYVLHMCFQRSLVTLRAWCRSR